MNNLPAKSGGVQLYGSTRLGLITEENGIATSNNIPGRTFRGLLDDGKVSAPNKSYNTSRRVLGPVW
jgi:hypothetical protein